MPIVEPLSPIVTKQARRYGVEAKLKKQILLLEENPRHPSLNWEVMRPKELKVYSFRIDLKYRALCVVTGENSIRIQVVTVHYK